MYYYVPNWLYSQHPSNAYSRRYIFLRPVVAPYTAISGTLFWSTFIMLHRQNTLYSAQGLFLGLKFSNLKSNKVVVGTYYQTFQ